MPGELQPRGGFMPGDRNLRRVGMSVRSQRAQMRAVTAVAESAMHEVVYLTRIKNELALACPAASEAIALIWSTASMTIAQQVAHFGQDVGW